jgi:ferredoxin
MATRVDTNKCTGCALCVEVCPVDAIKIEDDKAQVDEGTCIDCGACAEECPNDAISTEDD